ncbi:MAG: hypothetical protein ACXW2C_03630 [Acidimicrobiia bacterium]
MIDEPVTQAAQDPEVIPAGTAVLPWTDPEPPAGTLTGFAQRVTDLGLGAASLLTSATVDAVERFVPGEPPPPGPAASPGMLRLVPGALLGAGIVAQRRLLDVTAAAERNAGRLTGIVTRTPLVGTTIRSAEGYLADWNDRGEIVQARNRALVTEFVRRLAPELATALVTQLDMDALVAQLPIDSIIKGVDIDALLERVDVQRIIDRVDVEGIIDRVDVDQIVARVDVDKIVSRVDMDTIMQRVDIVPMAQEVITEVDIGSIVRASTGSIGGDARDGVRVTAMRVDGFLGKVTDRVLLRRKGRATAVDAYDPARFVSQPADHGDDTVADPTPTEDDTA